MPEGVAEPVVEQAAVATEQAQEQAVSTEAAVATEQAQETHDSTQAEVIDEGVFKKRLGQVWARAKTAEARMIEEREARIRAETEAAVLRETRTNQPAKQDEKVLSWAELKALVADNKISEADALEYREKAVRKQAVEEAEQRITSKLSSQTRLDRVAQEIERYKDAIPDVNKLGTDERAKFDTEFRYQVDVIGLNPKDTATQLTALRAVYGSPDKAVSYAKAKGKASSVEPYAETSGGASTVSQPAKTWKDKLQPHETKHYERMIAHGRYGDPATAWDRIKEEHDEYNKRKGLKG